MKILVTISRIFVAALFLFSGFIKLNDPLGFSYKLQEYFSEGVLNLEFLIPFALLIAVFLVIFEIVVGITLILGYLPKFTVWSLLAMIVFFTFLTFYSAYFNKVTDCGCFGDALPLTPWESFTKDVILLIFILILFFGKKYITPINPLSMHKWIVFGSFTACLAFAYYVLMHLPVFDFRAYKIGTDMLEGMEVPDGAAKAEFAYHWKFKVNGEEKIITTGGNYPKVDGDFISVDTEELKEGYEPAIHDFSIEQNGRDYTVEFLKREKLIMIVAYNLSKSEAEGFSKVKEVTDKAKAEGYTVIGLTASGLDDISRIRAKYSLDFLFYTTDETALKTIIRSNPGIVKLKYAKIQEKWHWNDADKLTLEKKKVVTPQINEKLKKQLDSVMILDQDARNQRVPREELQVLDSTNTAFVETVFEKYGYPGKSLVGEQTSMAAWLIIHHSDKVGEYLPLIKKASEKGELDFKFVAMMEDRHLMKQNLEQIYGTQSTFGGNQGFIWPIKDPETVNQRRKEAGFEETIEEYCQRIVRTPYKVYTLEDVEALKKKARELMQKNGG